MIIGYHLFVLIIAGIGGWRGWHDGLANQLPSILGFAFGAVCSHIFAPVISEYIQIAMPWLYDKWYGSFVIENMGAFSIFIMVYLIFKSIMKIFVKLFSKIADGVLNSLFGGVWGLFIWLLWGSIILNLMICRDPNSSLIKASTDHDANLAGIVVLLAPDVLGSMDASELAHLQQIKEAKKIS